MYSFQLLKASLPNPSDLPPPPTLPSDLFPQIIEEVHLAALKQGDLLPTLARLTLVNKAFLFIIRPLLWSSLTFEVKLNDGKKPARRRNLGSLTDEISPVSKSLQHFPHLTPLVKSITLRVRIDDMTVLDELPSKLASFKAVLGLCSAVEQLVVDAQQELGDILDVIFGDGVQPYRFEIDCTRHSDFSPFSTTQLFLSHFQIKPKGLRVFQRLTEGYSSNPWSEYFTSTSHIKDLEIRAVDADLFGYDDMKVEHPAQLVSLVSRHFPPYPRLLFTTLPGRSFWRQYPPLSMFDTLWYLEIDWRWRWEEDEEQNPLDDLASFLASTYNLRTLRLRGSITKENMTSRSSFTNFLTSFPSTVRYLSFIGNDFHPAFVLSFLKETSAPLESVVLHLDPCPPWNHSDIVELKKVFEEKVSFKEKPRSVVEKLFGEERRRIKA